MKSLRQVPNYFKGAHQVAEESTFVAKVSSLSIIAAFIAASLALTTRANAQDVNSGNERGLAQSELDSHGLDGGLMSEYQLKLRGYADAGYVYNFTRPSDGSMGHG